MISRKQIMDLLSFNAGSSPVLSFYMGIGVYKARRKAYEIEAKDIIKKGISEAKIKDEDLELIKRDAQKVLDFIKMDFHGKAKGLAIFSSEASGLWQVYRLPVSVPDRCVIDTAPYVSPMLKVVDESRRYCVVVVDKEKARLFTMYLGVLTERTDLFDVVPGRHKQGGWSQARFQRHIEDHVNRHLTHVADTIFEFYKSEGFGHLILGGTQEITTRLFRILHSYLQGITVGTISVDVTASVNEILQAAGEIEREVEEEESRKIVGQILEGKHQGHITLTGLPDCHSALKDGRVHTLVLVDGVEIKGRYCEKCSNVEANSVEKCGICGEKLEDSIDVAEHLAVLAVEHGSEVKYVESGFGLEEHGGVGAILRW